MVVEAFLSITVTIMEYAETFDAFEQAQALSGA